MFTGGRITISSEEYEKLKEDSLTLRALEESGVDNWGCYSAAMDLLEDLREEEDESNRDS